MTITARYSTTCPCCHLPISVGAQVEWAKGSPARHAACSAVPGATVRTAAPSSRTCSVCGHTERRNARGYVDGDWVRGGVCQSCREERAMGY